MRNREATALVLVAGLVLSGCATMQERRWGSCAVAGGLLGAAVGGSAAGVTVHEYEGGDGGSTGETAIAAASGAVGGALVGTLLGHLICDPQKETPAPPAVPPPPPAPKKISLSGDAHFDFDSATLRPAGEQRVDAIVDGLQENPSLTVLVEGYTDSVGSEQYNQRLSEARANAVRDYMVSRGIDASRISTRGYGETQPVESNETAEGRVKNRRVEITTR